MGYSEKLQDGHVIGQCTCECPYNTLNQALSCVKIGESALSFGALCGQNHHHDVGFFFHHNFCYLHFNGQFHPPPPLHLCCVCTSAKLGPCLVIDPE